MFENDGVAGIDPSELLVGVDLEPAGGEDLYFVVLILEVDGAIIILKGPHKGEAVGAGEFAFYQALPGIARSIFPENDRIVFFASGDGRVEGVEAVVVIGVEAGTLISPGVTGQQLHVVGGTAFGRATGNGKAG
jgi:hypothetical protein